MCRGNAPYAVERRNFFHGSQCNAGQLFLTVFIALTGFPHGGFPLRPDVRDSQIAPRFTTPLPKLSIITGNCRLFSFHGYTALFPIAYEFAGTWSLIPNSCEERGLCYMQSCLKLSHTRPTLKSLQQTQHTRVFCCLPYLNLVSSMGGKAIPYIYKTFSCIPFQHLPYFFVASSLLRSR